MITILAAIGSNNALGKNNDLIWHLPADLKRFKKITSGHHIIMGRKTYESIGKPLPNRTSVVITRNRDYFIDGCLIAHSIEEALRLVNSKDKVFIIGGAEIYKQALETDLVDTLDLTIVHDVFDADVFFPELEENKWVETTREFHKADDSHLYDYSFVKFKRK